MTTPFCLLARRYLYAYALFAESIHCQLLKGACFCEIVIFCHLHPYRRLVSLLSLSAA